MGGDLAHLEKEVYVGGRRIVSIDAYVYDIYTYMVDLFCR